MQMTSGRVAIAGEEDLAGHWQAHHQQGGAKPRARAAALRASEMNPRDGAPASPARLLQRAEQNAVAARPAPRRRGVVGCHRRSQSAVEVAWGCVEIQRTRNNTPRKSEFGEQDRLLEEGATGRRLLGGKNRTDTTAHIIHRNQSRDHRNYNCAAKRPSVNCILPPKITGPRFGDRADEDQSARVIGAR